MANQKSKSNFELPKEIPYAFLKMITNDFAADRKISEDPFGTLYKGIVPDDGRVMAVKKLIREDASTPPNKTFRKEVQNVMILKHENIVQIIGYCSETSKKLVQFDKRYVQADGTELLICYEYFPNGSLHENLFGIKASEHIIDWDTRFKIVKGICQGLRFLHTLDILIVHVDLKLENIWLDANMVPKLGNFALSRIFGQEQTRFCTETVVGSYGYLAPEYLYRGEISAQTDIYSLGLVIIEIFTGEKNCSENNQPCGRNYIDRISRDWTEQHIAYKYSSLHGESLQRIHAVIKIGLECVEIDRRNRPSIEDLYDKLNASWM